MSESLGWLYEYLRKFLESPGWRNPILQFIDQNCYSFDENDENKFIYTELHIVRCKQKFKELVDGILKNLCVTLGVSDEQFAKVCDIGRKNPQDKKFFQQIFACDNFLSFKKLMVNRNKEFDVERKKIEIKRRETLKLEREYEEEGKKRRELNFGLKLSKEAIKTFLRELKKRQKAEKAAGNQWKVIIGGISEKNKVYMDSQLGVNSQGLGANNSEMRANNSEDSSESLHESEMISLKSKPKKSLTQMEGYKTGFNHLNSDTLELEKLNLKEQAIKLALVKLQLEKEAKKIEQQKRELEALHQQKLQKKLEKQTNPLKPPKINLLQTIPQEFSYSDPVPISLSSNSYLSVPSPHKQS